jgi:NADPH:quinone reductase-like Zn-dependent oxidoreductase
MRIMKAAQIAQYGDAGVIRIAADARKPTAGEGQVLVEVRAASLNPVDSAIRQGYMHTMAPLQFPATLGFDMAGVVVGVGPGVGGYRTGDKVWGLASILAGGTGAFAEFAAVPIASIGRAPSGLTFAEAASLPLAGVSALQGIHEVLKPGPNRKILITGGSGGIGSLAIQMARALGAYVATTCRGGSLEFVNKLGADVIIDLEKESPASRLKDFDLVLDTVGGEIYKAAFAVLRKGGSIFSLAAQPDTELAAKRGVKTGSLRTEVTTARLDRLSELVTAGAVKPHIYRTYPLAEVQEAFRAREAGKVRGKIVLLIGEQG